jgi:hypothetical protein
MKALELVVYYGRRPSLRFSLGRYTSAFQAELCSTILRADENIRRG